KNVKILGEDIKVGAEIYDLPGFSGHADQNMLLDWIDKFQKKHKKIFIVHGEEEEANALSLLVENLYKIDTIIPKLGDSFSVEKQEVELTKEIIKEPDVLKQDIEKELEVSYRQFKSLIDNSDELLDEKLLDEKYDR